MGNGSLYFDIELPSSEHVRMEKITRYFMRKHLSRLLGNNKYKTMKRGVVLRYDKNGKSKQIGVWGTC